MVMIEADGVGTWKSQIFFFVFEGCSFKSFIGSFLGCCLCLTFFDLFGLKFHKANLIVVLFFLASLSLSLCLSYSGAFACGECQIQRRLGSPAID